MIIAINDISFLHGFENLHDAKMALIEFGEVCLGLKDEKVSKVAWENDIVNSSAVNKSTEITPGCTLMQVLNEIGSENKELFLFILQLLTKCGCDAENYHDTFNVCGIDSSFCACHRNDCLLSIVSNEEFGETVVVGSLNGTDKCHIRNIAHMDHKYTYWDELGFREYELNKKHGPKTYYRAGGLEVGIAPETDELGQQLLNCAIEVNQKLYAVDREHGNRIFEFRHSYLNKFHGFQQKKLSPDLKRKILESAQG
jgi:hypothetical protein